MLGGGGREGGENFFFSSFLFGFKSVTKFCVRSGKDGIEKVFEFLISFWVKMPMFV